MNAEELSRLVRQRPFQPFRIHLREGDAHEILYPQFTLVTRRTMVIGSPDPLRPDLAGPIVLVSPEEIVRVEMLHPAESRGNS